VGEIFELAIPIADLRGDGSEAVSFFVTLTGEHGFEVERHPVDQPIEAAIPDGLFAARQWRV
jgi:hypothetical protein